MDSHAPSSSHPAAQDPDPEAAKARQALWALIKDMRFGMLTHRHPDGSLHSHPLTTQNRSLDDGCLYFFVSKGTELGERIEVDGGVDDPNLELVEMRILHAEYWSITESKVTQLFKMASAAVSGQPPVIGEHKEVPFGARETPAEEAPQAAGMR